MPGVMGPKGGACTRARWATGRGWGTWRDGTIRPAEETEDPGWGAGEANSQGLEGGWTQGSE